MEASDVRAFLAGLDDEAPDTHGLSRVRFALETLGRPDVRYLVAAVVGDGASTVARCARAVLEAAGAPTQLMTDGVQGVIGLLDEPLLARAGTLAAASFYQQQASHPELGEMRRREMAVVIGLVAFAETNARVALLLDPRVIPDEPSHAPAPDLVVLGRLDKPGLERAMTMLARGRPAVAAPQSPDVRACLERAAPDRGVPLLLGDRDFAVTSDGPRMALRVGDESYEDLDHAVDADDELVGTGFAAALALGVLGIRMRPEWVHAGARVSAGVAK
ncbi:MAG: hypothetical protein M3O91_07205 [Chloroflexota bacterium]|nr:hypothetical protein [Chloroflexota bacterium]